MAALPRVRSLASLCALLALDGAALAQSPPGTRAAEPPAQAEQDTADRPRPPAPADRISPEPARAGARDAGVPGGPAETPLPSPAVASDPLLEVPPSPPRMIRSWRHALTLVRRQSTSLRRSALRVQLAGAQARQALARTLPTVSGGANLTHHLLSGETIGSPFDPLSTERRSIPDPATTWQASIEGRLPLLAPQAWYDIETRQQGIEAAALAVQETERQLLASLAESIVSVVTAERLAEVSRVSLSSALSTLELTRRRARFGAASALDVLRAEQEASRARGLVISSNESVQQAREALGVALGSSDAWGVPPSIRVDHLADDVRQLCRIERDVNQRSDVRAARAQKEVAERQAAGVDLSYLPGVDLATNLTYWSSDRSTPNGERVTWTIGGVLAWQIYDGGLRSGQRQAAHVQAELAAQDLTDSERRAELEAEQSARLVSVADANLAVSQQSNALARETLRLARTAYVNGTGTSFELVDAERQLRQAEIDLAVKEFQLVRARLIALLARASCAV